MQGANPRRESLQRVHARQRGSGERDSFTVYGGKKTPACLSHLNSKLHITSGSSEPGEMADRLSPRKQPKRIRSDEQKLKKKGYDLARAKSRVNIGVGFQRWRNLRELKCMKTDEDVALFLLDCFDPNSLSPGIALRVQSFAAAVPGPTPVKSEELNHSSADEVVVKLECLLQLFQECLACCSECSISTERDGWFFYVTQKCQQCHYSRSWASHPTDQIISDPADNHEVSSSDSESVYSSDTEVSTEQNVLQNVCLDQGAMFNIRDIISKAPNGRCVLSSLEENQLISHPERRSMVRILVSHLMERCGENPTSGTKALLASSIVEQFPCLRDCQGSGYDAWFTPGRNHKPATGFLEERLRNVRKRLHKGQRRNSTAPTQQETQDALPESAITTERAVQLTEWLKSHTWPQAQVHEAMMETVVHRAQWIRAHKARPVQDIIAEFPRLVDTPNMISQDFAVLYPESSGRLKENWSLVYAEKIIRMARTKRTHSLLTNIDLLPTDKRGDIALQLLPVLLPAAPYKVGKRVCRHSSVECQRAFINTQPIGMAMADYLAASTAEHPYVLMLGEEYDCSQVFVVINGTPQEHRSLLSAVDACFKAFFILQLQYPKPCAQVWEFIQTVVFGIPGHESNAVKLMRAQLSA